MITEVSSLSSAAEGCRRMYNFQRSDTVYP